LVTKSLQLRPDARGDPELSNPKSWVFLCLEMSE
jgi:hypothetical protein